MSEGEHAEGVCPESLGVPSKGQCAAYGRRMMQTAYFCRLGVGVALLVYLFSIIDLKDLPGIDQISVALLIVALLLAFLDRVCGAYKWSILIRSKRLGVGFREVLRMYFKSSLLGLILPSNVGGEFAKVYSLARTTSRTVDAVSSVIVERMLGVAALTFMLLAGSFAFHEKIEGLFPMLDVRNLALVLLAITLAIPLVGYLVLGVAANSSRGTSGGIRPLIRKWRSSFADYGRDKMALAEAIVVSALVQVIRVVFTWSVGSSIGVGVELSLYVIFVPLISLVGLIPVSPAALGVQEGAFIFLFSGGGANRADALAMGVLVRILTIASVLPGAMMYVREGWGTRGREGRTVRP